MIIWDFLLTGIKSADTGKYNSISNMSLLTYTSCNVNVHMVALRKLAMPVAGGVPCVGSTFYFPRRYIKLTTCINNLHYEKFQDGTVKCIEDEIPFEVPEGWAWSRLVSLTAIITKGASPKWQGVDYTSSGTMFITSENVEVETLLLESPKFLPEKINKIQPRSILETHDILTNIVGASIGRTCEYTLVDSANTNQAVAIIRLIAVDMVSYVVKCLNSDYCVNLMFANQVNVARANLSLSSLANFLIPIPPLKEMYRIIAHLDCSLRHISGIQSSEDESRQLILLLKQKSSILLSEASLCRRIQMMSLLLFF